MRSFNDSYISLIGTILFFLFTGIFLIMFMVIRVGLMGIMALGKAAGGNSRRLRRRERGKEQPGGGEVGHG